jgi:Uma2 family endonuclease
MTMGTALKNWLAAEEYLALEMAAKEGRAEYFDGEIYAMSGGSQAHNFLTQNMAFALRQHLKGSPCRSFMNDIRLRVDAANCYFYPDVFVSCQASTNTTHTLTSAKLVVEVLSPSTSAYDKSSKFDAYRKLADLQEYVLVDSEQQRVEVYRRATGGDWIYHVYLAGDDVKLASVELIIASNDIYDGVDFSVE